MLQLHFNSFADAYLVPIELILCIMEKIALSPIWCPFIRDKMSKKEGVACSCSNKNRIVVHSLKSGQQAIIDEIDFSAEVLIGSTIREFSSNSVLWACVRGDVLSVLTHLFCNLFLYVMVDG